MRKAYCEIIMFNKIIKTVNLMDSNMTNDLADLILKDEIHTENELKVQTFFDQNSHLFRPQIKQLDHFFSMCRDLKVLIKTTNRLIPLKSFYLVIEEKNAQEKGEGSYLEKTIWSEKSFEAVSFFVSVCAYLSLEVSKKGNVYYLQGESDDYKDSRPKREKISLKDPAEVSRLCERLIQFNKMGRIEKDNIKVGITYLKKLIGMLNNFDGFLEIHTGKSTYKQEEALAKYNITRSQYGRLEVLAKQFGCVKHEEKTQEKKENFKLSAVNLNFITTLAEKMHDGDKNAALNYSLDSLRKTIELKKQRMVNEKTK